MGFPGSTIPRIAFTNISEISDQRLWHLGLKTRAYLELPTMALSREMELRINGHLQEIRQVNNRVIGSRQGFPPAIRGYNHTLVSVAECATIEEVDQVAEFIKSKIRDEGDRPRNRKVRREARSIVSQAGYPADSFLNAA